MKVQRLLSTNPMFVPFDLSIFFYICKSNMQQNLCLLCRSQFGLRVYARRKDAFPKAEIENLNPDGDNMRAVSS